MVSTVLLAGPRASPGVGRPCSISKVLNASINDDLNRSISSQTRCRLRADVNIPLPLQPHISFSGLTRYSTHLVSRKVHLVAESSLRGSSFLFRSRSGIAA